LSPAPIIPLELLASISHHARHGHHFGHKG